MCLLINHTFSLVCYQIHLLQSFFLKHKLLDIIVCTPPLLFHAQQRHLLEKLENPFSLRTLRNNLYTHEFLLLIYVYIECVLITKLYSIK